MSRKVRTNHPMILLLLNEMAEQLCTYEEMAQRSGVSENSIKAWAMGRYTPQFDNLEACFNVLGYTLVPFDVDSTDRLRSLHCLRNDNLGISSRVVSQRMLQRDRLRAARSESGGPRTRGLSAAERASGTIREGTAKPGRSVSCVPEHSHGEPDL